MSNTLDQIRVVLVEPTHPGNVGAVARALKTMGLHRLVLVKPKKFPHYEATKRAAGAQDVLDSAVVVETLDEAVADCTLVLGTSVRDREVAWPTENPHRCAVNVYQHLVEGQEQDSVQQVAILFGRESSGLTNAELDLCQAQIRIPANADYSSLNLASAVQIIAYELRMQCVNGETGLINTSLESTSLEPKQQMATKLQREGYIEHLQKTLEALHFIKAKPPTVLMRKLVRLYNKANLTVEEIQILRGILSAIDSQLLHAEE